MTSWSCQVLPSGSANHRPSSCRALSGAAPRLAVLAQLLMPDLADLDAAADEIVAGGGDVLDDEDMPCSGSRHRESFIPDPNWIEAGEPGGVN